MDELRFDFDEIIEILPDQQDYISLVISERVHDYCNERGLDINDVEYDYDIEVKVRIKKK